MNFSKYQQWYDAIIARARARRPDCYVEWHHIVPRGIGGSDDSGNLVALTYREHFLVHWLLTKIYVGENRRKMIYAFRCMSFQTAGRMIASWQFSVAKKVFRDEAIKRLEARRIAARSARRDRRQQAQDALIKISGMDLSRNRDRKQLKELVNSWTRVKFREHRRANGWECERFSEKPGPRKRSEVKQRAPV